MPSIAWSTVAVLALLLPGFFFFAGLNTPEGFSRDLSPRNPLGALAAVVLVSFTTHAVFTGVSALIGAAVDWAATLSAVQLAPPSGPRLAARAFAEHPWHVTIYILTSSAAGLGCGAVVGTLVVGVKIRGKVHAPFRCLAQHRWVYELDPGRDQTISYVHVLADVGYDGRQVLYSGRLEGFGIAGDGAFSYLIVAGAQQRFLRLDHKDVPGGAVPHTGPLERIGTRCSDPARLVIAGAGIKNVVFQGVDIDDLRKTGPVSEQAAWLKEKVGVGTGDPARGLDDVRAIIREVADALPMNAVAVPLPVGGETAEPDRLVGDGDGTSASEEAG